MNFLSSNESREALAHRLQLFHAKQKSFYQDEFVFRWGYKNELEATYEWKIDFINIENVHNDNNNPCWEDKNSTIF